MRPAGVNQVAVRRDLAEREAFVLEKMTELAHVLLSYSSAASHTDPHLRRYRLEPRERDPGARHCTSLTKALFTRP